MSENLREKPHAEKVPDVQGPGSGIIREGHYEAPPSEGDGSLWVRTTALIRRDRNELYEMWSDVEAAPRWQEEISSVTKIGSAKTHWVMQSGGKTIEWDSQIVADEPGRRIAWRSIGGESDNSGEVMFEDAPAGRGTLVTVLQEFRMGKLASAWETLRGRNPKQAVIENLRHFKQLAETGEIPRTQGQPHGPRGVIGSIKESAYAEKIAKPPGMERKAS
jgi:uncharacterized membrane protein